MVGRVASLSPTLNSSISGAVMSSPSSSDREQSVQRKAGSEWQIDSYEINLRRVTQRKKVRVNVSTVAEQGAVRSCVR